MNTCIKCGCQDAYPSLPPCPVPAACPNPQPCSEVFDAQCIVYTLPDILCGTAVVVTQDSTTAQAIQDIVEYFCSRFDEITASILVINQHLSEIDEQIAFITNTINNINIHLTSIDESITTINNTLSGTVLSVTGLNTDNTDPQNPIVKISVDGTSITGLGTPASPLVATGGGVSGSGTNDYISKWTPDGNTLGDSIIQNIGDQISIGALPDGVSKVYMVDTIYAVIQKIAQTKTTGINNALSVQSSGVGATANTAIGASASGATVNIAVSGSVNGSGSNYGGFFQSSNATTNIGVYGQASGTGIKYSSQLIDGTEGIGKVLTCMTSDGKANWVTPATPSGGMTWSTLTGINPSAAMLPNHGYIIRDTSGSGTVVTLPVYGTCSVGDKIEIIATGPSPASLSNWTIQPGQAGDIIYASYVNPSATDTLEVTLTTGGSGLPITFDGSVIGSVKCRKVSMTLVCVKDNATNYFWQMSTSTNYALV